MDRGYRYVSRFPTGDMCLSCEHERASLILRLAHKSAPFIEALRADNRATFDESGDSPVFSQGDLIHRVFFGR